MVNVGGVVVYGLIAVAGLVGIAMLRRGIAKRVRANRTANATERSIANVTDDDERVSVTGTVENPANTRRAHIADASGVVVKSEEGQYHQNPGSDADGDGADEIQSASGSYDYRQEAIRMTAFDVDDGTGIVHVPKSDDVDAVLEPDATIDVRNANDPQDEIAATLDANDDLLVSGQSDRFRESVLDVGDEVTVQGTPQSGGDGLELAADGAPLLVSDGSVDDATERQADGWLGNVVLGGVFLAISLFIAYITFAP